MAMHKFKIGRSVFLQPTIFNRDAPRGAFEVIKQLPERDGQFEYRIKSSREPHERVAKESELGSEWRAIRRLVEIGVRQSCNEAHSPDDLALVLGPRDAPCGRATMTVDESKGLTKGTRVYWRGDAADSGIVTETSWDAVTIAWSNGKVASVHHGDMREIQLVSTKPRTV
jgi:hypothetical protein